MSTTRRLFALLLAAAILLVNGSVATLAENVLTLPTDVRVIEEEAFRGDTSIDKVVLPEGITSINARAFSDSSLSEINLTASLESIDGSAFDGPDHVSVTAQKGTYAYDWAVANGYINQWPESSHPFPLDDYETWQYVHPEDAAALKVTFDPRTVFEDSDDYIYITDANGNSRSYTDRELSGVSLVLAGSKFSLSYSSDGEIEEWGFAITDIIALSQQEYDVYRTEHPFELRVKGDGTAEIEVYRGMDSVLNIPAEIDGKVITSIGNSAFEGNAAITEVTIPEGVTYIGYEAFAGCAGLTEITIPGSVEYIQSGAFYECTGLETLTVLEGVQSIGSASFGDCTALTKITLPASVVDIENDSFDGCDNVTEFIAPEDSFACYYGFENGFIH